MPEKDKWNNRKQGNSDHFQVQNNCFRASDPNQPNINEFPVTTNDTNYLGEYVPQGTGMYQENSCNLPSSISLPSNLQLCGCYMKDIAKNTLELSNFLNPLLMQSTERKLPDVSSLVRPRKLKLDKTLAKYKHKSLPVSPVSEECQFSDFVASNNVPKDNCRKSFSYFIDLDKRNSTDEGFKQICHDIEQFSQDFSKNYAQIEKKFQENIIIQGKIVPNISITPTAEEAPAVNDERRKDEDEGSFSSDSLEDCSFNSTRNIKTKVTVPPRRCVSNNEIYKYQIEEQDYTKYYHTYDCKMPKSESFYLNQSNRNSQESLLSEDDNEEFGRKSKSYCNSMESVLSNESDCKSAPLEALFSSCKRKMYVEDFPRSPPKDSVEFYGSLPKNYTEFYETTSHSSYELKSQECSYKSDVRRSQSLYSTSKSLKTIQTQTEINYETPEEKVAKRSNISVDFQQKLLKFEKQIAQNKTCGKGSKKGVAFFVETNAKQKTKVEYNNREKNSCSMYIPTLESKNKQYKSKFCNVLNNKPDFNVDIYESGQKNSKNGNFTLTKVNFEKNKNNQFQETASLDRHLLTRSLLGAEKIYHKPPKGVRRNSTKTRKSKTSYEYIRKDDFYKDLKNINNTQNNINLNINNENRAPSNEKTIEFNYKEKNIDKDCEASNKKPCNSDFYDSLDKQLLSPKMENDSLEGSTCTDDLRIFDSLEYDKNVWSCNIEETEKQFPIYEAPSGFRQETETIDKNNQIKSENSTKQKQQTEKSSYTAKNNLDDIPTPKVKKPANRSKSDLDFKNVEYLDRPPKLNSKLSYINLDTDRVQFAVENIKILNEIQKKIHKINSLVDIFKRNMFAGKVRALSSMYESMSVSASFQNDTKTNPPIKFRRRNLSLPNFMERRLNFENRNETNKSNKTNINEPKTTTKTEDKTYKQGDSMLHACNLFIYFFRLYLYLHDNIERKRERGA